MSFSKNFIESAVSEFRRYKTLGDKTFTQLSDKDIHWQNGDYDNSIAIIVKHLSGNMLSRWTNFLTKDGEKTWRNRDTEFEESPTTKAEMIVIWEKGWNCLFDAMDTVTEENFNQKIKIRNENHSIIEAVHRQLAHYAGHIGQIIYIGRMIKGKNWQSLSIPKGGSVDFNKKMFGA